MRLVPTHSCSADTSNSAGRNMLLHWFPTWMGWYSSTSPESSTSASSETTQLEGEILRVLSDSAENNTLLKRDVVFGQFSFTLKSGTFTMCTMDDKERYVYKPQEIKTEIKLATVFGI